MRNIAVTETISPGVVALSTIILVILDEIWG
jgi:hypothetical protein